MGGWRRDPESTSLGIAASGTPSDAAPREAAKPRAPPRPERGRPGRPLGPSPRQAGQGLTGLGARVLARIYG